MTSDKAICSCVCINPNLSYNSFDILDILEPGITSFRNGKLVTYAGWSGYCSEFKSS